MEFKVVPFNAQIGKNDTASAVANQMQTIVDAAKNQGWSYLRMDSVQTSVAGSAGCAGIGATPGSTKTYNVLVFTKSE